MNKKEWENKEIKFVLDQHKRGHSRHAIAKLFKAKFGYLRTPDSIKHCLDTHGLEIERDLPRVLVVDIETKPKKYWTWGAWDQNLGPDMMIEDGAIMSWSAKWIGEDKVFYSDQRGNEKSLLNDKKLLEPLRDLMDRASTILWQNGDSFDYGEINARFVSNGIELPSEYKTIDTKKIAKRHLRIPYYSLAYMSARFNKKYKKQDHAEFSGMKLWIACMNGVRKAWNCMKTYNRFDVLSTEELFVDTLAPLAMAKGNATVTAAMRAYRAAIAKKKK
jgi:hypothetical protein